jgi:hypothetical protein
MNSVQQKEVVALVTWLQTFPEFVFSDHRQAKLIADGQTHVAVEALVAELDTWTVVRYVTYSSVTVGVCVFDARLRLGGLVVCVLVEC